jgi:hypothetical protein
MTQNGAPETARFGPQRQLNTKLNGWSAAASCACNTVPGKHKYMRRMRRSGSRPRAIPGMLFPTDDDNM